MTNPTWPLEMKWQRHPFSMPCCAIWPLSDKAWSAYIGV
jgi:hypothetical protein